MIIKRYIVDDMKEALIRAKYELGKDAIIVSQRNIRIGKWYNPFKKNKLEVTLAIEEGLRQVPKPKETVIREAEAGLEPGPEPEKPRYLLKDLVEKNPMFKSANDRVKDQLIGYFKLYLKENEYLTKDEIVDFVNSAFQNNCFQRKCDLKKINVFVGPTGVGKTTTIAKVAAHEYLINQKKVGLMTMDTYRIGAVEQIKTYANILGIPCEVVKEAEEMPEKLHNLRDCDLILIDTLGTSQRNKGKLEDIEKYLQDIEDKNTYLVISMSTDKETSMSILERYKQLAYDALILTKFDEISSFTNFWNMMEMNPYPVQYFCYGQDVPDDIKFATLDNLIAYSQEVYEDD